MITRSTKIDSYVVNRNKKGWMSRIFTFMN